jgi:hypothetical protein
MNINRIAINQYPKKQVLFEPTKILTINLPKPSKFINQLVIEITNISSQKR